jgi:Gpi18-like mannosyltransferase
MTLLALLGAALLLAQLAYRSARAASLTIDALPVMLPIEGMHEPERFSDRPGIYRWTNGIGRVKLPNPGGPAIARLVLAGGPGRSIAANLRFGALTVPFVVRPEPRAYFVALPASAGERLNIAIDSPTVTVNNRDLGVVVSDLTALGGGAAPGRVILALALATLGVYMLLRQTDWPPWLAAVVVVLLQGLALLWQAAGGWRYAIFGPALVLVGAASLATIVLERWRPGSIVPDRPPVRLSRDDRYLIVALIALALCLRLPWLTAPDPVGDLELSVRRMAALHANGLTGAYAAEGDYMPLRLYWLYGFSALAALLGVDFSAAPSPVPIVLIKLPGLLADLATIALLYTWCRRWRSPRSSATLTALYALAPPIWMNVAWWGQVDAILMLPLLAMVVLLDRADGRWSWLCWALALLIKPQAIIFAPLLYIATLRQHGSRNILIGGALAAGLLVLGCAPLILAGQGPGLLQAYVGSIGRFPQLTSRAYNLWYLVTLGSSGPDLGQGLGSLSFRTIGMLLMGGAALLVCIALFRRSDGPTRAEGAAVQALAFFALPTQIHERYLFLSLAFLMLSAAADRRMLIPFCILTVTATLNILGALRGFLPVAYEVIAPSPLPLFIAVVNLLVLLVLAGRLLMIIITGCVMIPRPLCR